jgi:putative N-acetylmannosamine-6-phosphate epimerase
MPSTYPQIEAIRRRIIVSCQAGAESPLHAPHFIAALAKSAELGGAGGFRVDGAADVAAVRADTSLPIIGINKQPMPGFEVFITPTFASARSVVEAGADLVALDGTNRPRPGGENLREIIQRLHEECGVPVMADIATAAEGLYALELGADMVATTLAGYTSYTAGMRGPALEVLRDLVAATTALVLVEGRIWTVEDVRACFEAGAYAVVIGSAITVPQLITRRFVEAIPAIAPQGEARQ